MSAVNSNLSEDIASTEYLKPLDEAKEILNDFNYNTYLKVLDILNNNDRCAVIQPTGTGKTYIMMSLLRHNRDKQKIVIAPSTDFLEHLKENKFWVFKDEDREISTFTYSKLCRNKLQISLLLDVYKVKPENVSMILIDEMHRVGAEEWSIAINNLITLCPNAKVVGLTATPKRYREDRNMAEEFFKDKVACNINLADAVKLGLLTKLDYVVGISDKYKNSNTKLISNHKSTNATLDAIINDNYIEYINNWNFAKYFESTLKKYLDTDNKVGKFIVFTNSIAEAKSVDKYIKNAFNNIYKTNKVKTYQCHTGVKNCNENVKMFFEPHIDEFNSKKQLKADLRVAITVNKLSESFHDKDLKAIIMLNRNQSVNVYVQQIGRLFNGVYNKTQETDAFDKSKKSNPVVFDFLDSINSIDRLKEEILSSSLNESDNDSVYNCVFENYYNETNKFISGASKIERLSDLKSSSALNKISKTFKTIFDSELNTYSCIYDTEQYSYLFRALEEIEKFNENINIGNPYTNLNMKEELEKTLDRGLSADELDILYVITMFKSALSIDSIKTLKNTIKFNLEILNNFDYSTFNIINKLKNNCELTVEDKRLVSSKFNKALILNRLSKDTIEYFKQLGLNSSVTSNKEKLYSMLKKRERKFNKTSKPTDSFICDSLMSNSDSICIRVLNLYSLIHTDYYYKIHLNDVKIAEYFENHTIINMGEKDVEISLAYWLWNSIREEYSDKIKSIYKASDDYNLYSIKMIRSCNNSRLIDNMDIIKDIDSHLSVFYELERVEEITDLKLLKLYGLYDKVVSKFSEIHLKYIRDLLDFPKNASNLYGLSFLLNFVLKYNGVDDLIKEVDSMHLDIITNNYIDLDTLNKLSLKLDKLKLKSKDTKLMHKWSDVVQNEIDKVDIKLKELAKVIKYLKEVAEEKEKLRYEPEKYKEDKIQILNNNEKEIIENLKLSNYRVYSKNIVDKYIKGLNKIESSDVRSLIKVLSKQRKEIVSTIKDAELAKVIDEQSLIIANELRNKSKLNSEILNLYPSISVVIALVKEYSVNYSINYKDYYKEITTATIGSTLSTTLKYITSTFCIINNHSYNNEPIKELLYSMLDYLSNLKSNSTNLAIELLLYGFSIRTSNKLIHIYRSYCNNMSIDYLINIASSLRDACETDLSLVQDMISLKETDNYSKNCLKLFKFIQKELYLFRTIEKRTRN